MKKIITAVLTVAVFMTAILSCSPTFAQRSFAMMLSTSDMSVYYSEFDEGWFGAIDMAQTQEVVITLGGDWLAGDADDNGVIDGNETTGNFLYYKNNVECGTKNGSLLLTGNANLTIDLNGHKISRGLTEEKDNGQVFTLTGGAKLTITDTSANANGIITGGNNSGYGGAFYIDERATLTLNGGKISGNHANYGGGVYICNALFFMNGGIIEKNSAQYGGGIALDHKYNADAEYLVCKGGKISDNTARVGGGLDIGSSRTDSVVTFENIEISDNYASDAGGGMYLGFGDEECKATIGKGTLITKNYSDKGGGVYAACGGFHIISARITNNRAYTRCGGIGVEDDMDDNAHGNIWGYGTYILGGDVYIQGNYVQEAWTDSDEKIPSNLHIGDVTCDLLYDASNPFTEDASIGIDMYADFGEDEFEEKLTDSNAGFEIDSYRHFTADNPAHVITARDGGKSAGANRYQIYMEQVKNAADGTIKSVSLKPAYRSELAPVMDRDKSTVTFMVNPKMKKCVVNSTLYELAEFSFGADVTSIAEGDKVTNLLTIDDYQWQVMSKNNSYEIWNFKVLPHGGTWSDEDNSAATVTVDGVTKYYPDFERAWAEAIESSIQKDTLLVFNKNWYAGDFDADGNIDPGEIEGVFKVEKNGSEYGTNKGRLYLNDNIRLTIDLNGHTLSRNLSTAVDDGQVFSLQDKDIVLTIKDSVGGGKITGGNNKGNGGAFYVYNGSIILDGVELSGNRANNGGAIYWYSNGTLCLTDTKITQNFARDNGGGVYVTSYGSVYLGGKVQITENSFANMYLSEKSCDISNAAGQVENVLNKPLTEGAKINILSQYVEDLISADNSRFNEGDFRYMYSDNSSYFIRSLYNPADGTHAHKLYFNSWGNDAVRYPRVKSVSVKNSELIESAEFNYDTQTVTLTARNTKKNYLARATLYNLINCTYDKDIYYIYRMEDMRDLRDVQEYKIMSDNGTYVLFTVKLVPSGGAWAPQQEDVASPYVMTVTHGTTTKQFNNSDEGWAYAVSQTGPVTLTLFEHWVAKDGAFSGSGAAGGYLYMNNENLDITIDLNGYTIDRGLKSAISNGQVFKLDNGKLTITDSVGTGKITGGNTTGNGGAFWVEYGTLRIKGGEIKDNNAKHGGAIYCNDLDDAFICIEGGKFVGNKAAENGGAIYMYDGYLEVTGGEISGNTAKNGAGIYWESNNSAFLTGGKIINNNATVSGGVYVKTNGDVYVGGDVTITGNGNGNLYLYDGACISNACNQETGVPDKPLSENASIGISASDKEELISADNSKFGEADFDVMFSDSSAYFIRSAYDADDEGHEHKLYINSWSHKDSRYPRVKTVSVKNNNILQAASLDYNTQIVTLTVPVEHKEALKSVSLSSLISCTYDNNADYLFEADKARDFTTAQEYKIMSDNGTYVMCVVKIKWLCTEHTDANSDNICDECNEYTFTDNAIVDYNAQTKEATVFITKSGKYNLVFADYEGDCLENIDVVEYDFKEGINVVPQKIADLTLAIGDKVMLWHDLLDCVPACDTFILDK